MVPGVVRLGFALYNQAPLFFVAKEKFAKESRGAHSGLRPGPCQRNPLKRVSQSVEKVTHKGGFFAKNMV
jgi:hypothetical protein